MSKFLSERGKFTPSREMLGVLVAALDFSEEGGKKDKIKYWCEKAGVHPSTFSRWRKIEGFNEWWDREIEAEMRAIKPHLLKIGIKRAESDFRYWEVMMKKYGGLDEEKRGGNTFNFNIPRPDRRVIDADTV